MTLVIFGYGEAALGDERGEPSEPDEGPAHPDTGIRFAALS
ncbi:hypothetical protein ACIBEA_44545 [Streptomyces sp. NPDC051555]